ncbi:hypothetical protein [Burkholderia sp. L27(2015)]|uniref:hypothetical protein n=1 Tax=Burkholderia sp. L27(2015) TaxID=1641858 RepID=UPI00131BB4C5|nr:hypothetical protein [Burkholderia sp. L27(2015)]
MKNPASNLNQAAAFVNACSNFVTQLDAHQVGGAMFVCCIALVGVVVVALSVRAALPSREDTPKAHKSARRAPAVGNNQQPRR